MSPSVTVILQTDLFSAHSLRHHLQVVSPGSHCVVTTSFKQAVAILLSSQVDLFLTTLDVAGGDVLDLLLSYHMSRGSCRALVTTPRCATRIVISLRALSVHGVFDSVGESPDRIQDAIRCVGAGQRYWSPLFIEKLNEEATKLLSMQLSPAEQLAFAIIGDGCGDHVAAYQLGMEISSVRTLRRRLYSKIGVHDKEDMVRAAARLGYTRFTSEGVTGLGIGILVQEYLQNSRRPTALSPALLNAAGALPRGGGESIAHN